MDIIVAVLVTALVTAAVAAAAVLVVRGGRRGVPAVEEMARLNQEMRLLAERMGVEVSTVTNRLEGIDDRLVNTNIASQDLARNIFDTLGEVRRATGQVAEQAREFTALQDMLRAPKTRGGIGEAMLEEMLRQVLPPAAYEIQHRFKTGATVDAAVRAGGRLVSIDAKFPLDNFRRICDAGSDTERARAERDFAKDVMNHINAISVRYILPDEDTLDFALMYVPAEGVYGEVLRLTHVGRPLYEWALDARVIPVGPLTIYGYLQTLLFGLKCVRIEESAQDILDSCGRLQRDMGNFAKEYATLGSHIRNASRKYDEGRGSLDRLEAGFDRMAELGEDARAPDAAEGEVRVPLEVVND